MNVRTDTIAAVDSEWRTGRAITERTKWAIGSVKEQLVAMVKDKEIEVRKADDGYTNEYRLPQA